MKVITGAHADDGPLAELAWIAREKRSLAAREAAAVRQARMLGISWEQIGTVLHVSRQAIHKKYGRH